MSIFCKKKERKNAGGYEYLKMNEYMVCMYEYMRYYKIT